MNLKRIAHFAVLAAVMAAPAAAQLALPPVGQALDRSIDIVGGVVDQAARPVSGVRSAAEQLAQSRLDRIAQLVRSNRASIERDSAGELARKGELLVLDPPPDLENALRGSGFTLMSTDKLAELGVKVAQVSVPAGLPLAKAQKRLQTMLPGAAVTADNLHFQSGGSVAGAAGDPVAPGLSAIAVPVGVIDAAPGAGIAIEASRGFARGAPLPSDHGSAVASLLRYAGVRRITVADVYGNDPAGGNALAIARGLDWLIGRGIRVISISLVGPANPLLASVIGGAQRRGAVIVAAVGNDGPAAPPSYPASYPGVIAVTAVDARNRALIEAGRALHLDYAAPGADMVAANARNRWVKVRGTSYATPLVAARVAAASGSNVVATLDREAIDLGTRGADRTYGRGLLCTICRPAR